MDLIYQNPFRILGIPVTATDREIAKQINDMAIYSEMGKSIEYESDNFFAVKPNRTPEHIQEAKQNIEQPNNKLFYSLFWFWENSNNTIDEMAFEELKNGNIEKAIEFWERETKNGITSQNKSNHKNLSVLRLGLSAQNGKLDKNHFLTSLSLSGEFLANGHFDDFTKQVLGVRHSVDLLEITNLYVDEIISLAKPHLSQRKSANKVTHKELLTHFETYPDSIQNDIIEKFIGKHIHNIEKQIEKTEKSRKDNVAIANKSGFELYKKTQDDLQQLQAVFSKSDLKYQLLADKLAEEILQCSIDYFNSSVELDLDPGEDSLKLAEYAKIIAVGEKSNNRVNENYITIKEYTDEKPIRTKIDPIISLLNKYQNKVEKAGVSANYNLAKEFVFSIKKHLDNIRLIIKKEQYGSGFDYIKNVLAACAGFVNSCGVTIANSNSQYGKAIELVDMAKRILLYEGSNGEQYTINKVLSDNLENGRSTLSSNISNQEGGLINLLFSGGIRMVKKRIYCGCGSGKKLNECCSV